MSVDAKALGWYVAAGCTVALLAVVSAGWMPDRARSAHAEPQSGVGAPGVAEIAALAEAIARLDQRLARIESALAAHEPGAEREPVMPDAAPDGQPASSTTGAEGLDEVHRDLLQMSKRIDLLAGSLKETHKPAYLLPTLEQIHAARRDLDWAFLNQLRQLCVNDRDAARARVRFMTFDDVLRKIGLPTSISTDDGSWHYIKVQLADNGQQQQQGISFRFVGDMVSSVGVFP